MYNIKYGVLGKVTVVQRCNRPSWDGRLCLCIIDVCR